jgi:serine/threonine protein phosphatase 1
MGGLAALSRRSPIRGSRANVPAVLEISKFAVFRAPCRVWTVGAVHGEFGRLAALHRRLERKIETGDRLVYLGNLLGRGAKVRETVDEVLLFRRQFLARAGNDVEDFALLRGSQEEMWQKLFELQFAVNPHEVLAWMIGHGAAATIETYGGNPKEGLAAARQGTIALARWTNTLRESAYGVPGHRDFMAALRRAAYTSDGLLLFVSAGIDPHRPLDAQADALWWSRPAFDTMDKPYFGCRLVVRGFDPKHRGVKITAYTASIDGGCGHGGSLVAACVSPTDGVIDLIEA